MGKKYGYARVSTKEQNLDRQTECFEKLNILKENIFCDKSTGKDFNREQYQKMLRKLKRNDVLYIKSIDRLGRNYDEIIVQWRTLTKEMGIDLVVVDMPLLDTRREKNLIGTLLSDIVLQLLSFVAETERDHIKIRQAEGIEIAKKKGVKFGRPPKPLPDNFKEIYIEWERGNVSGVEAAKACNMPVSTFAYKAKRYDLMEKV